MPTVSRTPGNTGGLPGTDTLDRPHHNPGQWPRRTFLSPWAHRSSISSWSLRIMRLWRLSLTILLRTSTDAILTTCTHWGGTFRGFSEGPLVDSEEATGLGFGLCPVLRQGSQVLRGRGWRCGDGVSSIVFCLRSVSWKGSFLGNLKRVDLRKISPVFL